MEWNGMEWNQYITIQSHIYIVIVILVIPAIVLLFDYNFGPEWRAGLNLSMNRNIKSLFLAGSTIVLLIAKLRICPVPAGIAPPFLSPPPCCVSV
jgi:hypothetical protein